MKNVFTKIIVLTLLFLIGGCSSDNFRIPPLEEARDGDCFDGILNGDEVIVDCGGECPGFCPPNSIGILGGEVRGEPQDGEQVSGLQLNPTIEYRLIGPLLVRDRASLSIPAGTVIKVDPNAGAYIAIAQGGSLLISGQPDNPVVITSGAENPAAGDWGGIIICGQGPTATGEVERTDIIDIFYGGTDIENSSGGINYLRVEYAGALAENEQNFDAISFYGVGAFTNITNVQTYESLGNGIRFIGGNADAEQLVATNSGGNAIVLQDDWSGNGEEWFLSGISNSGVSINTDETIEPFTPAITDTISNISIIGPAPEGALSYSEGGGKYVLTNVITDNMNLGINVEGSIASEQIALGSFKIDSIQFQNPDIDFIPTNYLGPNTNFYSEGQSTGAGNGSNVPDWANGWTIGLQ